METLDRLVEQKKDVGGRQKAEMPKGGYGQGCPQMFLAVLPVTSRATLCSSLFTIVR